MLKSKELLEEEEKTLRNPQLEFEGLPNLTVQTGNKSIAQMVDDFTRAGRAIMVARADEITPEIPGLPAYPDPIETELLRREVNAELIIARNQVRQDQQRAQDEALQRSQANEKELAAYRAAAKAVQERTTAPQNEQQT